MSQLIVMLSRLRVGHLFANIANLALKPFQFKMQVSERYFDAINAFQEFDAGAKKSTFIVINNEEYVDLHNTRDNNLIRGMVQNTGTVESEKENIMQKMIARFSQMISKFIQLHKYDFCKENNIGPAITPQGNYARINDSTVLMNNKQDARGDVSTSQHVNKQCQLDASFTLNQQFDIQTLDAISFIQII
ncbi:MAG: hypothetical protein EZS28_038612, partial [Streblomastix strix]